MGTEIETVFGEVSHTPPPKILRIIAPHPEASVVCVRDQIASETSII